MKRKYETIELKFLVMQEKDVLTLSVQYDEQNGDFVFGWTW